MLQIQPTNQIFNNPNADVSNSPKGELEKKFLDLVSDYKAFAGVSDRKISQLLGKNPSFVAQIRSGFIGIKYSTYESMVKFLNDSKVEPLIKIDENAPPHQKGFTTLGDYYQIEMKFVSIKAVGSFVQFFTEGDNDGEWYEKRRFIVPKFGFVFYDDAITMEIEGNSMAPRYTEGSVVRITPVDAKRWDESIGVHVIIHKDTRYIKRIKKNTLGKDGTLELHSDNPYEESFIIKGEDIIGMWKVRDLFYSPPEN